MQVSTRPTAHVTVATFLAGALGLAVFLMHVAGEILESVADHRGISLVDRPLLDWVVAHRTPGFTAFVAWFSNTGGPVWMPIITLAVTGFLWWRWRDATPLVLTAIAAGGALVMTILAKNMVERARPPQELAIPPYEVSFSFPSGHSLNSIVILGMLCYALWLHRDRRPGWATAVWFVGLTLYAAAMGLSRVFLGHHWLTDVLAAWLLGLGWIAAVIGAHRLWLDMRSRRQHRATAAPDAGARAAG